MMSASINIPIRQNGLYSNQLVLLLQAVVDERLRQEKLRESGMFQFTCSNPVLDNYRKASILGEEMGEVCKAVNEIDNFKYRMENVGADQTATYANERNRHVADLKTELVQVAAVAIAWAESL